MRATFELEAIELDLHGGPIAGVDEAGRGPLAGPVVAAVAVVAVRLGAGRKLTRIAMVRVEGRGNVHSRYCCGRRFSVAATSCLHGAQMSDTPHRP